MTPYQPRDLLSSLPLVKDCPPDCLRHPGTGEPLVAVNGSLAHALPASIGRPDLEDCVLVPINRLRKLFQLWPQGEPVSAARGSYCDLHFDWSRKCWRRDVRVRRFLELRGGAFTARLETPSEASFRRGGRPGRWRYSHVILP